MIRRPAVVVLSALVIFVLAVSVYAQRRTVRQVRIVSNPRVYNGPCPATLTFTATVFVNRWPVEIEYEWIRSDGATSARRSMVIRSAGQGISDTWTLGAHRMRGAFWEQLHVLAPTGISSPRAVTRVTCR